MLFRLSETIRSRRKELKLTQPMLAELAGVSTNTIFKIENGLTNPTVDILEKIADILGMEINLNVKDINKA